MFVCLFVFGIFYVNFVQTLLFVPSLLRQNVRQWKIPLSSTLSRRRICGNWFCMIYKKNMQIHNKVFDFITRSEWYPVHIRSRMAPQQHSMGLQMGHVSHNERRTDTLVLYHQLCSGGHIPVRYVIIISYIVLYRIYTMGHVPNNEWCTDTLVLYHQLCRGGHIPVRYVIIILYIISYIYDGPPDGHLTVSDIQIHWFSIINSVVVVIFLSGNLL